MEDSITITIEEIMEATGIGYSGACTRMKRFRAGVITRDALFAQPKRSNDISALISEVEKATGLTHGGAIKRVYRYKKGKITREKLFAAGKSSLGKRIVSTLSRLRDRSREEKLASIPGPTEWERRNIGI